MENERRTKKLEWRSLSGGGETKKIKVPVIDALGRAFIFFSGHIYSLSFNKSQLTSKCAPTSSGISIICVLDILW